MSQIGIKPYIVSDLPAVPVLAYALAVMLIIQPAVTAAFKISSVPAPQLGQYFFTQIIGRTKKAFILSFSSAAE